MTEVEIPSLEVARNLLRSAASFLKYCEEIRKPAMPRSINSLQRSLDLLILRGALWISM